jgi:hypothetical protein
MAFFLREGVSFRALLTESPGARPPYARFEKKSVTARSTPTTCMNSTMISPLDTLPPDGTYLP